jgi:hypothetical protein
MTGQPDSPTFTRSLVMRQAVAGLEQAITTGGGVLISGEPGTGRELFARAIHEASAADEFDGDVDALLRRTLRQPESRRPFLAVDCRRINDVDERLFGKSAAAAPDVDCKLERFIPTARSRRPKAERSCCSTWRRSRVGCRAGWSSCSATGRGGRSVPRARRGGRSASG